MPPDTAMTDFICLLGGGAKRVASSETAVRIWAASVVRR